MLVYMNKDYEQYIRLSCFNITLFLVFALLSFCSWFVAMKRHKRHYEWLYSIDRVINLNAQDKYEKV